MNIENVGDHFIKAADILKNDKKTKKLLKCEWFINKNLQKLPNSRIYLFVVNDEIKKIGGSSSVGGIKSTISFYESANIGKPSVRSFGVMKRIYEEISNNNKVELYVYFIDNCLLKVLDLQGKEETLEVYSSFKHTENKMKENYFSIHGKYPEWNFQENNEKWNMEDDYIKHRIGANI